MLSELARIVVRLIGDSSSYTKMLREAADETRKIQSAIASSTVTIEKVREGLHAFAATLVDTFSRVSSSIMGSLQSFIEFDHQMVKSKAIIESTAEENKKLRDTAIDLARTGGRSVAQLAEAYYFLFSAGMTVAQSTETLAAINRFAVAGQFDLNQAVTLASDAQLALGLQSQNTAVHLQNLIRVTDVLVRANTLANASTEQFSRALTRKAGAALRSVGKEIEEGVAVLAVFANQGIKDRVAGENLTRLLQLLQKSTLKNADAQKALGFSVFDSSGKMKHFGAIVQNLETILGDMNDEARAAALAMLGFEARVVAAILPLIGSSKEIFEFEKKLKEQGFTSKVAGRQAEALAVSIKVLQNQFSLIAVEMGEMMAPAVKMVVKSIVFLIQWWASFGESTREVTITVVSLLAAFAGFGVLKGFVTYALGAIGATKILGLALAGLLNPIKLAGMALTALLTTLSTTSGFLAFTGMLMVAIPVAIAAAVFIMKLTEALENLNKAMEKNARLEAKVGEIQDKRTEDVIKKAAAAPDVGSRKDILSAELKKQEAAIISVQSRLTTSTKRVEEFKSSWEGWKPSNWPVVGGFQDLHEATRRMDEDKARLEGIRGSVTKLKDELSKLGVGPGLTKLKVDIISFEAELKKTLSSIGLTADRAKLREFKLLGASKEDLANATGLVRAKEIAEKNEELRKSIKETTKSLEEQAKTFNMSSREAEIFKLKLHGATEAQVDAARAADRTLNRLEAAKRLIDRGLKLTEEMKTPAEKLQDTKRELQSLFETGAISAEIYARALRKAEDAGKGVEMQNAALANSAEANRRIDAFREKMRDRTPTAKELTATITGTTAVETRIKEDAVRADKANVLLTEISTTLKRISDRTGVAVGSAALAGP